MKKIITLILILLIISTCTKKDESMIKISKKGKYPITKEKVELTVMFHSDRHVSYFENNKLTEYMEKKTNVHIKWVNVPGNYERDIDMKVESGIELPDIIIGNNWEIRPIQQLKFAQKGAIIPLNDLIEKNCFNLKKMMSDEPLIKKIITLEDGKIYAFPRYSVVDNNEIAWKMWVNKKWMENLNIKDPETTEDFYNMLKAFKEKDPNKNGKADEIPYSGTNEMWGGFPQHIYILNSFGYCAPFVYFYLDKGKVKSVLDNTNFKDGVEYLRKLYKEGLLDINMPRSLDDIKRLINNDQIGAIQGASIYWIVWIQSERGGDWKVIAPLKGPKGIRRTYSSEFSGIAPAALITKDCKYPEIAARWIDYLYTQDFAERYRFGEPGVDWEKPKKGELGLNDKPAKYKPKTTDWDLWQNSKSWQLYALPVNLPRDFELSQTVSENPSDLSALQYDLTKKYYIPYCDNSMSLPPLKFSLTVERKLEPILIKVFEIIGNRLLESITLEKDINDEWDYVVEQAKDAGIDILTDEYQNAFDKQWADYYKEKYKY